MRIFIPLCEHVWGALLLLMWRIRSVVARNMHTHARARTRARANVARTRPRLRHTRRALAAHLCRWSSALTLQFREIHNNGTRMRPQLAAHSPRTCDALALLLRPTRPAFAETFEPEVDATHTEDARARAPPL